MTEYTESDMRGLLRSLGRADVIRALYRPLIESGDTEGIRWLARNDRFFLLGCLLMRADVLEREWCFDRAREVEAEPEGWLDLWSRFHYKSTIITYAGAIQEILRDPEVTIGVLSYNKRSAHGFVEQIRRALEMPELTRLFPDVLYARAPKLNWSTQNGLIVRRKSNPKEATLFGSGLVDGQPVGAHYALRIYDDVVVPASVTSPEQIRKTTEAWELSLALGTDDGGRAWYAGTRYHMADTYSEILARGVVKERRRLCVDETGAPTMMTRENLETMRLNMGAYTWSAQMMQNPIGAGVSTFKADWWQTYFRMPPRETMNIGILIDSANAKRKTSDYTVMLVVGWGRDRNYYLLDGVHERLNLSERTRALFDLVRDWRPQEVFWEQVGCMSDADHVQLEQDRIGWHFPIQRISQKLPKDDRIRSLQPLYEQGRMWAPTRILRTGADGQTYDLVKRLHDDEYITHPVCRHDDMIDCLANVRHPAVASVIDFPADGSTGYGRPVTRAETGKTQSTWKPFAR